jgi:hypothetical protein
MALTYHAALRLGIDPSDVTATVDALLALLPAQR